MISALVKLFVTVFVAVPVKLMAAGIKVGAAMMRVFVRLVTLPVRVIA